MNLAYVAGLIDGEGCIQFTANGRRGRQVPRIMIINTNLKLLEDVKAKFGGNIQPMKRAKSNWKTAYCWQITNSAAVRFAEKIERWVRIKREQIWLLYAWDAVRPGTMGVAWDEGNLDAMTLIKAHSKWLNWRGEGRPDVSPVDEEIAIIQRDGVVGEQLCLNW